MCNHLMFQQKGTASEAFGQRLFLVSENSENLNFVLCICMAIGIENDQRSSSSFPQTRLETWPQFDTESNFPTGAVRKLLLKTVNTY